MKLFISVCWALHVGDSCGFSVFELETLFYADIIMVTPRKSMEKIL